MKKSLKTIVCKALEDQDVPGNPKVEITKVSSSAYNVQITTDSQYIDDIDEMYLYDAIADTSYVDYDINIEIVDADDVQGRLDYVDELASMYEPELTAEDSKKSEEEIIAEEDDLHIFDIGEDASDDYSDCLEEDEDCGNEPDDLCSDYVVTWEDVEDFDKEFGEYE